MTLDVRGQLASDDEAGRAQLAARAGSYALLPTCADLFVLVRTPPNGAATKPPRAVLTGDAGAFPVSDLIAFLGQSKWSGAVRVHSPTGERSILLKEGEVRGASSDHPAERIGEVMVRMGYLSRDRLEQVLEEMPPSKVGRVMVERGFIQPHDLWKCLTEQVSEIFHAMVLCKEGVFLLVDQELDEKGLHTLSLSLQSLLMDSIRKIDEMAHFRKRIPHGRQHVAKKRDSDGKLEKEEDRVLSLVDGERTVLELGQAAKMSEFDATRVVYRLLEGGYVQVSERRASAAQAQAASKPPSAQAKDPRAVIRVFNFIFREIRDEVSKQHMEQEFLAAANAAIAKQALTSSPVLFGQSFDAVGNLAEDRLLAQFEKVRPQLGSAPLASLRQALSEVMFFLLFQAGELLESRADEDLARRVKELLSTLDE
ncbi:MAG: DUF4388 domain-containing protein [Myxococcales bacterium]|nr:DUF4388 domain-containing protein [Myxococcales bacterium]